MAEIKDWRRVIELAERMFKGARLSDISDPRFTDAAVITIITDKMRAGKDVSNSDLKDLDKAVNDFANKTNQLIKDTGGDGWQLTPPADKDDVFRLPEDDNSSDKWKPPADENDIFRPVSDDNSSIGEVTAPKTEDDIYRLVDDDSEEEAQTGEEDPEEATALATPTPDGDDFTGIHPKLSGWNEPIKDPFDVSDGFTKRTVGIDGGPDTEVWDNYESLGQAVRFQGGDEPVLPWEKINPKY